MAREIIITRSEQERALSRGLSSPEPGMYRLTEGRRYVNVETGEIVSRRRVENAELGVSQEGRVKQSRAAGKPKGPGRGYKLQRFPLVGTQHRRYRRQSVDYGFAQRALDQPGTVGVSVRIHYKENKTTKKGKNTKVVQSQRYGTVSSLAGGVAALESTYGDDDIDYYEIVISEFI